MKILLLCIALLSCCSVAYGTEPYVFKGKTLGAVETEFSRTCTKYSHKENRPNDGMNHASGGNKPEGTIECEYNSEKVGDSNVSIEYKYFNDRLYEIDMYKGYSSPHVTYREHYKSKALVDDFELALGARFGKVLADAPFKPDPESRGLNIIVGGKKIPKVLAKTVFIEKHNLDLKLSRSFLSSSGEYATIHVRITDRQLAREYENAVKNQTQNKANEETNNRVKSIQKAADDL